jgi:hypothetical protein
LNEKPVSKSFPEAKPIEDPWKQLRKKPGIKILNTSRREP